MSLNGLGPVLLVVGHGVVAAPPRPGGLGRRVERRQFSVEGWEDLGQPGQHHGVRKLVRGDVLVPVPVGFIK